MKIELLSPAKDVVIGRSAILSGADAVYIGGSSFGARVGAGNDMSAIGGLVEFAHGFGARVYMTMNTILFDDELELARAQAMEAWNVGVDALIVQDMAYCEMGLPIELHASTQTFNFSAERVKFLEDVGFARVVLERGLSLSEIKNIRKNSGVELEAFIHGAICVGYSGQCYFSQAVTGRSGNRGECAQLCRSSYDLVDRQGLILGKNESVLSVGDMCMGERVKDLIDAGVCSLKIEGRLKNESYVVNNTSYYNRILNAMGVERSSSGVSEARFDPNPGKSFLRRKTVYFFDNRRAVVGAPTRSLGEYIGTVERVGQGTVFVNGGGVLKNGDGICWVEGGDIKGVNINKVEGGRIEGRGLDGLRVGSEVYRNNDNGFEVSSKDVDRKIEVKITVDKGLIKVIDSDGFCSTVEMPRGEVANNVEKARETIEKGLKKSGDTIFRVVEVNLEKSVELPFLPMSVVNELRRGLLDKLLRDRVGRYVRRERQTPDLKRFDGQIVDYLANVSNRLSRNFYKRLGMVVAEDALEVSGNFDDKVLLRSRFCVRRERGLCSRKERNVADNASGRPKNAEDLFIINNGRQFRLSFDCELCEMSVYKV